MIRFVLFLIFSCHLCTASVVENILNDGITIDLREPLLTHGNLTTEQGGIITAPGIRIQAKKIIYTRKPEEHKMVAEGDLMIEYGPDLFVGERIEFDFLTNTGVVHMGRGAMYPWYFGGEEITLCPDGTYKIQNAYFTTSEDMRKDWEIVASDATITNNCILCAKNLKVTLFKHSLFQVPFFQMNMDFIFDTPFRYYFQAGGTRGTRFGFRYNIFNWRRLKTYLRFDYRFFKGPGGGFELHYKSPCETERFGMINYAARDNSISNLSERFRYRFQGCYQNVFSDGKVQVDLNYDKLSDKDMATDYEDTNLRIAIAEQTHLIVRRQDDRWLTNFITKPRVNTFQTLKQELPTLETNIRSFTLGKSGMIMNNDFKASYLDFDYTDYLANVHDYSSIRLEYNTELYRPFSHKYVTFTPQVGGVAIYYQNSPKSHPQFLSVGLFGAEINTYAHAYYGAYKHLIKPYAKYSHYTFPTSNPNQHYIFDIDDGWYRLESVRFGVLQYLYSKNCGCMTRNLTLDLFAYAFINTKTIDLPIPRAYADLTCQVTPTLKNTIEAAWDFQRNQIAHLNVRLDWTLSDNIAVATEYRQRNAWDWRKVDYFNFILDSFRSEQRLRHSALSDRRDTILTHVFYRFHPSWSLEFSSRQGWNRIIEPKYIEYEVDFVGNIRSAWNVRFTYQHLVHDDRFAVSLSLGMHRPNRSRCCNLCPCVEF